MKFRFFIWISGFALIILIAVQYFFITETFTTKQQQFDSKYSGLAKLGLFEFENSYIDIVQDSLFTLLDDYAYFAMHDLGFARDSVTKDSVRHLILEDFTVRLNQSRAREKFLESYFENAGEGEDFITRNVIRDLRLLNFTDETIVYRDTTKSVPEPFLDGYLLNNYTVERNNYRVRYDYYIAFPEKSKMISREMILTITLALITLLIVFAVFYMTLRNLLIQKRLSDLKTDFINNMTHELKTPLSTISVASSSLARGDEMIDSKRILELSGIIKKQNRHLSRLIDRILDISIWEKDQVRIEPQETKIEPFIKDILNDFISSHPNSSFEIRNDQVPGELEISIDQVHMTTVINNLLSNAYKYGGDPPHIRVSLSTLNGSLSIQVEDNGAGIREEERRQIFDKFFRGKDAKQNAIKGLGLGLFYVKQIIEAHGGTVALEHSSGTGSVFNIQIPL